MIHTTHHQLHGDCIALQSLALQSDFFQTFAEQVEEPKKYIPAAVREHHCILIVLGTCTIMQSYYSAVAHISD
jgi:hypothetical protein